MRRCMQNCNTSLRQQVHTVLVKGQRHQIIDVLCGKTGAVIMVVMVWMKMCT